jgi:hypothetical protein
MSYNDCERRECARCSAKFCIFEQDALLADLLCGACWWELHDENDAKAVSEPVNPNECVRQAGVKDCKECSMIEE